MFRIRPNFTFAKAFTNQHFADPETDWFLATNVMSHEKSLKRRNVSPTQKTTLLFLNSTQANFSQDKFFRRSGTKSHLLNFVRATTGDFET